MSGTIKSRVIDAIQTVYDPEIPVNIWEIGLVYDVGVDDGGNVHVVMTLTSPMCPVAESLPLEVEDRIGALEGVESVRIEVTWDPPWHPDMMSDAAKLELGMY